MARYREVERKFEIEPGAALPDLRGVDGIAAVGEPTATDLEATYFDTPDLSLARHGVTLRRRTGGEDEGWHLKLGEGGDERTEVRLPLGEAAAGVPDQLLAEVSALVRDRELAPVAIVRTSRLERHLQDADGEDVAVVADDTVRAERLLGHSVEVSTWREVEVELVHGTRDLLDLVTDRLAQHGVGRSSAPSKLVRALGDGALGQVAEPELSPRSSAGEVVAAHLRQQVAELLSWDRAVRAEEADSVHKMRVASRRLRSALRTFRPLFDRDRTDPLREELKWLASLLGDVRDAEVIHARLGKLAGAQPSELLLGPVRRRIDVEMGKRHRSARTALRNALDGQRYFALLDSLDELVASPPFTARARRRADRELPKLARRAVRRVRRDAAQVEQATTPEQREHWLHEVRKDTKRARYAAESLAPAFGKAAKRLATGMEGLQEVLGEHQDSVVARQVLRELGVAAHLSGENGFSFGLMLGREYCRGEAAERPYPAALRAATGRKVRRWLG
jgi:CHAD domain-containing protein